MPLESEVRAAADALVARWESLREGAGHTGEFVRALGAVAAAAESTSEEPCAHADAPPAYPWPREATRARLTGALADGLSHDAP